MKNTESALPSVTFLFTVYNKEGSLAEVCSAIERQSGDFKREYLFIDDGSSDGSLELIKSLTKSWENVRIVSRDNRGLAYTLTQGLGLASCDFVKFVETDDVFHNDATECLLRAATKYDAAAALALPPQTNHDGESLPEFEFCEEPLGRVIAEGSFLLGNSKSIIKRSAINSSVMPYLSCVTTPDLAISLRFTFYSSIAVVNRSIIKCSINDGSRLSANHAQEAYDSAKCLRNFLEEHDEELSPQERFAVFRRALKHLWISYKRNSTGLLGHFGHYLVLNRSKYPFLWKIKAEDYLMVIDRYINKYEKHFFKRLRMQPPGI